jgi:hypothetical protein
MRRIRERSQDVSAIAFPIDLKPATHRSKLERLARGLDCLDPTIGLLFL